jgi:hypothetical protein
MVLVRDRNSAGNMPPSSLCARGPGRRFRAALAIRVGRAETAAKGVIEHAVILVENGKIVTIGEDLPSSGIQILDKPNWSIPPGGRLLRLASTATAATTTAPREGVRGVHPGSKPTRSRRVRRDDARSHPAGNGIPGQAVVIRPRGKTREEM